MSTRNQQAQALGRLGSAGQEPEQTESHAKANEAMTARAPAAVRLEMDTGIRKPGEPDGRWRSATCRARASQSERDAVSPAVEGLTTVRRHAPSASTVTVELRRSVLADDDAVIELSVTGRRSSPACGLVGSRGPTERLGLPALAGRVRRLGGQCVAGPPSILPAGV